MNEQIHGYLTLSHFPNVSQFQIYRCVTPITLFFNMPVINSSRIPVALHPSMWSPDFKALLPSPVSLFDHCESSEDLR